LAALNDTELEERVRSFEPKDLEKLVALLNAKKLSETLVQANSGGRKGIRCDR